MRLQLVIPSVLLVALVGVLSGTGEARQSSASRVQQLARTTTHFATGDIVYNRWSEPFRWPIGLLEEQQHVLEELRALSQDRAATVAVLDNADPKLRTLGLGALFIREDPQD